ncbi:response regulator [Maribacter chungangensis]|uniref:Response regulator n=1 Tax=Maribacter chungangensis TaxID=1069117 RepID=A0ABW3B3U5_9FLAO
METQKLKIIVIEKNKVLSAAYHTYLEGFSGYLLVATYTDIQSALKEYKKTRPDIIFAEIGLKGISGIDAIHLFRKKDRNVKVVMISSNNDFDTIKRAFKQGANGYLTKPMSADRLDHALTSIRNEGAAMSNDIVKKVVANFHKKSFTFFSERENQIVDYLFKGATYKVIADKLFVTTSTVNFHIQNIYLKLNVNSKSEALTKLERL